MALSMKLALVLGISFAVVAFADVSCPTANNTTFSASNGAKFTVECGLDRPGGDLRWEYTDNFASCIEACARTPRCVDVTYVGRACYLKNSIKSARSVHASSARLISETNKNSPISSNSTTETPQSSGIETSPVSTTSDLTCPAAEGQTYTLDNSHYTVECGKDRAGGDLAMHYAYTFKHCIEKCTSTDGCVGVSWIPGRPGPCYMKNVVKDAKDNARVWGARSAMTSLAAAASIGESTTALSRSTTTVVIAAARPTTHRSHDHQHDCGNLLPAGSAPGGQSQRFNLTTSDGLSRTWLLYVPPNYEIDTRSPLIISYHGNGASGAQQESITGFSTSINSDFLVAYPDGVSKSWQGAPYAQGGVDDVAFTKELISSISDSFCVDPKRLYASGHSNGGGFTGVLACDATMSTIFAAFGASSGAFYPGSTGATTANCDASKVDLTCKPGRRTVPFLEVHGDADKTIPYFGGVHNSECLATLPHYMTLWSEREGYGGSNASTSLAGGNVQYTFGPLRNETPIITHYKIAGLPHAWATASNNIGGFSTNTAMLDFFGRWTLQVV